MTKEEALAPHIKMSDASTYWVYAEDAKKAMDEYAKHHAALAFEAGFDLATKHETNHPADALTKEDYLNKTFSQITETEQQNKQ